MDVTSPNGSEPRESGGFSVIMAEKVLEFARGLKLLAEWSKLRLGNLSRRSTSYTTPQRIIAILAGLACGLRGIAPGNSLLRTNTALQHLTGGKFPDQGTIHRWLDQTTHEQAAALRAHLHQVVRAHGRFWDVLRGGRRLVVDLDGQGVVARGARFEGAAWGYLGKELDRGYQRFVAYVADTHEVLDEFLRPGNTMLTGELQELLTGLNEVFVPEWRSRVVIRADAHGGTVVNLQALKTAGYSYVCRMMSRWGIGRLRREVCHVPGRPLAILDSEQILHHVECWDVANWTIRGRRKGEVHTRAVIFREVLPDGRELWLVLLTDLSDHAPEELWTMYHQRGGTIEEYNDQSERAFHLQLVRTGCQAGLNALHALVALCWNITVWAVEELKLPPTLAPHADHARWVAALNLDRSDLLQRAAQSGLRLFRAPGAPLLEVEATASSPESTAWLRWFRQLIQHRLPMAA